MKYILCTGDSHTCGQYAYGSPDWEAESLGYNIDGKGFIRTNFDARDYVNIVRNYITDHTNSEVEKMNISSWGKEVAGFHLLERPVTIHGGCDALILKVAERKKEAELGIYVDGKHIRTKKLYADQTRYGMWSFAFVVIPCTGAEEITLKTEKGYVYIDSCERWMGDYAVVNCGVGSCTVGRYKNECLPELIEEFPERIFLAEVHTINDWVKNNTIENYGKSLLEMLEVMKNNSSLTMAITVSPILREQPVPYACDYYEKFVDEAYRVIEKANVPMIDAHKAFAEKIKGKTADELIGTLYGDDLHPRQPGYTLYAELIIEKLKGELLK